MIWTLLRGCCSGYSPWRGYGGEDEEDDAIADPASMKLDPVDVAGQANLQGVRRVAGTFTFTLRALLIITVLDVFMIETGAPSNIRRIGSERWSGHLKELIAFKLVAQIDEGLVKNVASYFAIPKKELARAIFNGKAMSAAGNPPPPTNLPDITSVLRVLATLGRDGTGPAMMIGDIRHYFHQLALHEQIAAYFCVYFSGRFYRWLNLPMGHAWSPFVAQSIAFGIVIASIEKAGYDVSMYKKLRTPPAMVVLSDEEKRTQLVAVVWYDNILIATRDHNKAQKLFKIVQTNFESASECNIKLKEWNFFGPSTLARGPDIDLAKRPEDAQKVTQPTYLGLNFSRFRTKENDGEAVPTLHWRIEEKRLRKWADLAPVIHQVMSCRTVARICGAVLWSQHIALRPLCRSKDVVELVRECGRRARSRSDWDTSHRWSEAQCETLRAALRLACTSQWISHQAPAKKTIVVCTDSSGTRWGRNWWDENRLLQEDIGGDWDRNMIGASIFAKELCAATMAIEHLALDPSVAGSHLRLLVDNSAAAGVLRRLASSTTVGTELAERVDRALVRSRCTMEVILISTVQNPADDPSRNRKVTEKRIALMWQALEAADRGSHVDMPTKAHAFEGVPSVSGLRHTETSEGNTYDDASEPDETDEWQFLEETLAE